MTFGKPCDWRMLRNSKVSYSNISTIQRVYIEVTHHLEPIRTVNHEEDEVRNLPDVDHGVKVVIAFNEGDAFLLAADNSNRALYVVEGLLGVPPDERLHERGLADAGRANHGDNDRRRLVIGSAVDERDMETCLVAFSGPTTLPVSSAAGLGCKGLETSESV